MTEDRTRFVVRRVSVTPPYEGCVQYALPRFQVCIELSCALGYEPQNVKELIGMEVDLVAVRDVGGGEERAVVQPGRKIVFGSEESDA